MADTSIPISESKFPYLVLSMDGGGIYGLFTAIMLRKLCEENEDFLKDDRVSLFAGTSAGAMIALILASEENPREAVLSGKVEAFFTDERLFSNKMNPMLGTLALFGLTSWSGKDDFYSILHDYFGNKKMKDLHHRVLITTFDFSGQPDVISGKRRWKPKLFFNFPLGEEDRNLLVKDVAYGAASPPTLRPIQGGIVDGGLFAADPSVCAIAKIVSHTRGQTEQIDLYNELVQLCQELENHVYAPIIKHDEVPEEIMHFLGEHSEQVIKRFLNIQKKLTTQHQNRALNQTITESMDRFAEATQGLIEHHDADRIEKLHIFREIVKNQAEMFFSLIKLLNQVSFFQANKKGRYLERLTKESLAFIKANLPMTQQSKGGRESAHPEGFSEGLKFNNFDLFFEERIYLLEKLESDAVQLLRHVSILSLGVGSEIPNYFMSDFDLGVFPFNLLPTNAIRNIFQPPAFKLMMDPTTDTITYEAKQLLGHEDYHRLNPPAIGFPTPSIFSSVYLAKFPIWRNYIAQQIRNAAETEAVQGLVNETRDWLRESKWHEVQRKREE